MEFEKDKQASAEEVALAEVPHMTVEPAHGDVRPDVMNVPTAAARPDNRNFEFDTESTAQLAVSTSSTAHHPHHRTALVLSIATVVLFGAALAFFYFFR